MVLDFLTEYQIPVVVGICLCVGFIVKKWIKDEGHKWIPTICGILGIVLALWINAWVVTPQAVLQGLFSGLASTGLHQMFKQLIEGKDEKAAA